MTIRNNSLSFVALFALMGAAILGPKTLVGQEYLGDFMFHPPKVTLSIIGGFMMPRAGSDIFQEVEDLFGLGRSDFDAGLIGGGLSVFLNDRIDLAFEFSYSKSSEWSYYLDFVDDDDLNIEQRTSLKRVPVTGSIRYFLMDRGRSVGNLSWISTTWSPYVGAGGGRMYYQFRQEGDLIDSLHEDCQPDGWGCPIFLGTVSSEGWAWVGHVFGGFQWAFSPQFVATAEGRYSWANADLDRPQYGLFEPIDLSGFQGMLGFGVRF